jgi:uncharacterized membrane protein YphA (DoxX/SURF4 family)
MATMTDVGRGGLTPSEARRGASQLSRATARKLGIALWAIQVLLAALFVFAGGMKLVTPAETLSRQLPLPVPFMRFIGVAELLGGLGLVLPGLLRIRTGLTPLAAAGLVVIMVGATVISLPGGAMALLPLVVGLLAAFIAYGRWRLAPLPGRPPTHAQG